MKKLLIITLMAFVVLTGCTQSTPAPTNEAAAANSSENVVIQKENTEGTVAETYVEDNKKYIDLKVSENIIKLDATNVQNFESIKAEEIYRVEYESESKRIVDITKINVIPVENQDQPRNKRVINIESSLDLTGLNEFKVADISSFPEFGITRVVLYTDAAKDDRGFHWDDGNRFVLVAHTADSGYILFDQRIQLGGMDVNIYSLDGVLYIAAMDSATADLNFRIYELINGNFEEDIIFDGQGNINMLYTSQ